MPPTDAMDSSSAITRTSPGRRDVIRATSRIGTISQRSCGGTVVRRGTRASSVGTSTIEIAMSVITPTAAPIPNELTA